MQLALQGNFSEVAAQLRMEDAESHASVGQCEEAQREVVAALALSRDNVTLERASRALGLCGVAEFSNLINELTKRLSYLGLARSAMLTHNIAAARDAYAQFFSLWKDADPSLKPLRDARAEYAPLQ